MANGFVITLTQIVYVLLGPLNSDLGLTSYEN